MDELRTSQVPAGEVGPEGPFTVVAVTLPALDVLGLQPKNLPPLSITSRRRGRLLSERRLKERRQKQNHEEEAYCHGAVIICPKLKLEKER
jgi:hypothetical protein